MAAEWIPTACGMCYNACSMQVKVEDGRAVALAGLPDAPPNFGKLCAKGNAGLASLYSPYRLLKPMRRTNPRKGIGVDPMWREISWEEALTELCDRLVKLRADDPRKLISATFDGDAFVPVWAFMSAFGSPNTSTGSPNFFCGNGVHPVAYTVTGSNDTHPDLVHCNLMIQFGTQHGHVGQCNAVGVAGEMSESRQRGMKMIVVDPMCSASAAKADEWLPILPGTDAALALAMIHVLLWEEGIYDREYLRRYTNGSYLVQEDGHYLREAGTGKPLVCVNGQAVPYDDADPDAVELEGRHPQPTAFQLLKEHLKQWTPERAEQVTTLPASSIRRVARQFGEAARIGATINLGGLELPWRPVCATWYRGVSQHKNAWMNGFSIALLNIIVGALDVPGGILNATASGPSWYPGEGPDGLIAANNPFTRHQKSVVPPRQVTRPETLELVELFPVSTYSRSLLWLTILEPEKYGLPYQPEMLIQCRANFIMTAAEPEVIAEALCKLKYIVSFSDHLNEMSTFADLVLPDTISLERLAVFALNPYLQYRHTPMPGDRWAFNIQQPVVAPLGEARNWIEVLVDVAHRIGMTTELNLAFNALVQMDDQHALGLDQPYSWPDMADHWAKAWCGDDHGLDYFKKHGYVELTERAPRETYPRPFHKGRIPIYLEHFIDAGSSVAAMTKEIGLDWDTSGYITLPDWRPCPSYTQRRPGQDLFLVNYKVSWLNFSISVENELLLDLSERRRSFDVTMHASAARRRGLKDGQRVIVETRDGRRAEADLCVTEAIHPDVVACAGVLGRWAAANPRARGRGIHFNKFVRYDMPHFDTVSAALDACVLVDVRPA